MYEIIFFILVPFFAMLYEGLHRKFTARLQNRIGPPVIQPFYDIKKLFTKKKLKTQTDPFFNYSPFFYFLSIYALFLFIPFTLLGFEYDFILLLYLTVLASCFYLLCGLSSNNPFSIIGSMREMILMVVYEMVLTLSIINFMIKANVHSFAGFNTGLAVFSLPLSSLGLLVVAILELRVTPFDSPDAPTEVMAGTRTEYTGRNLAFMEMASYLKRLFYSLLLPLLLFGRNLFIVFPMSIIFLFGYTWCQATTPRYRVDQAFKAFFIVMVLVLIEFILLVRGII